MEVKIEHQFPPIMKHYNKMFTVRLFIAGVDAKFDTKCESRAEAEMIQKCVEETSRSDELDTIILHPKDGGKTSGVYLKPHETPEIPKEEIYGFYSLVRSDNDNVWVIRCSNWETTDYLYESQLEIQNQIVSDWDEELNGFVVSNSQYQHASAWVNCQNQMIYNDEHPDYAEYEDGYWEPYEDEDSDDQYPQAYSRGSHGFILAPSGRGYLITVDEPTDCDFFGEPILYLTEDTYNGPSAVWDESKMGWIVNRRDLNAAKDFVNTYN